MCPVPPLGPIPTGPHHHTEAAALYTVDCSTNGDADAEEDFGGFGGGDVLYGEKAETYGDATDDTTYGGAFGNVDYKTSGGGGDLGGFTDNIDYGNPQDGSGPVIQPAVYDAVRQDASNPDGYVNQDVVDEQYDGYVNQDVVDEQHVKRSVNMPDDRAATLPRKASMSKIHDYRVQTPTGAGSKLDKNGYAVMVSAPPLPLLPPATRKAVACSFAANPSARISTSNILV